MKHSPKSMPDKWDERPIAELGTVVRGASPRPAGDPRYFNGDYLPWITVADVTCDEGIYLKYTRAKLTAEGAKFTRILEPGTLLLTNSGATLGVPKILTIKAGANDGIAAILSLKDVEQLYLYYYLQSLTKFFREIMAPGVGQPNLNTELIGSVRVKIPSAVEQCRIVEILSTWDRAIERTQKLIDAKLRLKRGLMLQLLTGKKRFAEFVQSDKRRASRFGAFPMDWPDRKIGEIASEVSIRNSDGNGLPVFSCTKYDGLVDSLKYFGKRIYSQNLSVYKVVARNEFAYATNHIEEGSIGVLDSADKGLVSPMYTVFRAGPGVHVPFLFKLFKTELYRHIFEVHTSASVNRRGSLRWSQFANIRVALPSLQEQLRIASCLSALDADINLHREQLGLLQRQKRGMMQVLLTGKVRVKIDTAEAQNA